MSAMGEMSRAIRLELEKHGATLSDIPGEVLRDYRNIVTAFALDLRDEARRRATKRNGGAPDPPPPEVLAPQVKTLARDAEIIFTPASSEEERADLVDGLVRMAADMDHAALYSLAVYDETREVEVDADVEGDYGDDSGIGQV